MQIHFSPFSEPGVVELDGGKGANLKALVQKGIRVPEGFVIRASLYRDYYPKPPSFSYQSEALLEKECKQFRRQVEAFPFPDGLKEEIHSQLASFGNSKRFAIRSSSTFEDLGTAAFAGQHDTFLNVGPENVIERVKQCFGSLWTPHAVLYRHHHGFDQQQTAMAVVVQRLIPGDISGVAFSIDPVSGNPDHVLIEANWGIGESVVGGEATTDSWVIRPGDNEILERRIGEKNFKEVAIQEGIQRQKIQDHEKSLPCMTDMQLQAVARLTRQLTDLFGAPQDVEWVYENEVLYALQSRPQTTIPPRFTRDESAERFPTPLTPLTWSYVKEAFNHSLDYSLALMNLNLPTRPWFDLFDHYVYGNQNAVEVLALHRPLKAQSFEELMQELPSLAKSYRWVMDLPQQWMRDLDRYLLKVGELAARNVDEMNCRDLQSHFKDLFLLANQYFKPNIAISMTQAFLTRILSSIIRMITGDDLQAHSLFKEIIAVAETKTGQINRELFDLAQVVRLNPDLLDLLNCSDSGRLSKLSQHPEFLAEFQQFISDYGHREIHFDYYHPTWAEAPEVVLDLILLIATSEDQTDPREREGDSKQKQVDATQKLFSLTPPDLHFFLQELIRLTLDFTFLDDLEHFQTTRLNLLARKAVGAFGRRLVGYGHLEDPYDLFFLDKTEFEAISTFDLQQEVSADLAEKIRERKQSFVLASETTPSWNLNEDDEDGFDHSDQLLSGTPGSPGEHEGTVYLVHGPADFKGMPDGAILVARTTNPAWTPLFYKAKAIITESGGPLSHGAVTARELGIPAVMSIKGCMTLLRNGDRVALNGRQGTVRILKDDEEADD